MKTCTCNKAHKLLRVIVLANGADSNECLCVLIGFIGVNEVEGGGVSGVTVAGREVHAHSEIDLATSHDIV